MRRWIAVCISLVIALTALVGVSRPAAATPTWVPITSNSPVVYYNSPWGNMQLVYNVLELSGDGTPGYDFYIIDADFVIVSGISAGYGNTARICALICYDFGQGQAVAQDFRVDLPTSTTEILYPTPQPPTTQGSTTTQWTVGVQAGTDGADVSASYSVSYTVPDVQITSYYNPQNMGVNNPADVDWYTTAVWNSASAQSHWDVHSLTLIEVTENHGLWAKLSMKGIWQSICTDWYCPLNLFLQDTYVLPSITIDLGETPPVPIAYYSPSVPYVGQTMTFNGAYSYDPDGDPILSYAWNFGDGTTASGALVYHAYSSAGQKTAMLTVSDGYNPPYTTFQIFTVYADSVSGYVKAASTGSALSGATVSVTDPGGTIHSTTTNSAGYYWIGLLVTGTMSVSASLSGYNSAYTSVTLSAGQAATVSFSLSVASGGGGGGGGCVAYGTPILTPDGYVPIQKLKPGDAVMEYSFATHSLVTGALVSAKWQWVSQVVDVNAGALLLTLTDQPIYVLTPSGRMGWLHDPQNLTVGDDVLDPVHNLWIPVTSVLILQDHIRVYDVVTTAANNFVANGILLDMKT